MTVRLKKIPKITKRFEQVIKKEFSQRIKDDDKFAQKFYASLCNTIWYNKSNWDIYSCSWRYSGGLVAGIRDKGEDYLDFYCSGGEEKYHATVYKALKEKGYKPLKYKNFEHLQKFKFERE